jgi:Protein of unknown function (DUF3108)
MRALPAALFVLTSAAASPAAADRYSLTFDAASLGVINLGEASVDADISDDSYVISATLKSGGLITLFEPTNIVASSSGAFANNNVHPLHYELDHHYSKKHRVVVMDADESGRLNATITPNYRRWGEPPATDAEIRRSRDPLSTLMAMAVDVGETQRCAGAYPTFDGRFHYLLELSGGEIDHRYRAGGYDGPVLKCTLGYIAVSGFEPRDAGRRRIPHGEVWFALADHARFAPPVRITTPLAAGGAVIRLTQWRHPQVNVAADTRAP